MTIREQIEEINQRITRLRSQPRTAAVDNEITQLREKRANLRHQIHRLKREVVRWGT